MLGIEFGEKLLYKVKIKDKLQKINTRWEFGIFVGVRRRSGEVWVAVKGKLMVVRSVRRIPVEERWSKDCVEWVDRVICSDQEQAAEGVLHQEDRRAEAGVHPWLRGLQQFA